MMDPMAGREVQTEAINPYAIKIFGEWFKKIILLVLLIPIITIFIV